MADNDEAFTPETNPNIGGGEIVGPGGTGPYTPSSNDVRVKDTYAMAVRIKSLYDNLATRVKTLEDRLDALDNIPKNCYKDGLWYDENGSYYDKEGYRHNSDGSIDELGPEYYIYTYDGYFCDSEGYYYDSNGTRAKYKFPVSIYIG